MKASACGSFYASALLFVSLTCSAQQGLFQSANGDSAMFLPGGAGVVSYNLGSDSARFDFERDSGGRSAFGGGLGGTIKTGAGSFLNKNTVADGGFVEGGIIYRHHANLPKECTVVQASDPDLTVVGAKKLDPNCERKFFRYTVIQMHYGRSQFYNLAADTQPIATPTQLNFNEFRGTIAFNGLVNRDAASFQFGIAYVPRSSNNLADLDERSYQSQTIANVSGTQTVLSSSTKDVYVGQYETHIGHGVNGDFVVQPGKAFAHQLGFDLMFRSDLGGGSTVRYFSPGVGAYLFKKGSPAIPVGGLAYAYKKGRSEVSLVVGWTFGGTKDSK